MTTVELLAQQAKEAHQVFLGTLEGVTDNIANAQPQGKALSIAAVWVHHVEAEDSFMSSITGQPTIESNMVGQTGFDTPQPTENWSENYPAWATNIKVNIEQLMAYTKTVFESTEKAIAGLTDEDLETSKDLGFMGQAQVLTVISGYIIAHCNQITGEISAIKGTQGLKGYPW
jgi:hypothetical protein